MAYKTFYGSDGIDEIYTDDLDVIYPGYDGFEVYGLGGDDDLTSSFIGRNGVDAIDGGDGDDFMTLFAPYRTPLPIRSYAIFNGGFGTDDVFVPLSEGETHGDFSISEYGFIQFSVYGKFGEEALISVSPTVETISLGDFDYLTEDIMSGRIRSVAWDEVYARTYNQNADWSLYNKKTIDYYYIGTAGGDRLIGASGANGVAWASDVIEGNGGDDFIGGGGGKDFLYGGLGNDEIRAGYGHDYLTGEQGADVLYGGGGSNTYGDERDGSIDQLFVMSDFRGHGYDWGRNHGGLNADIIEGLDAYDQIIILGTSASDLSVRQITAQETLLGLAGIGIFDGSTLEVLYTGDNLSAADLIAMTFADSTRLW